MVHERGKGTEAGTLDHSTKRSLDKFEPISGDLALRAMPCDYFPGSLFFVATYLIWPQRNEKVHMRD